VIISEIEKDIKMPTVRSKFKYPWDKMELNDSIFITAEEGESLEKLKRQVGPAARYYGNVSGKKFKTILMRADNGIRVWRIE
jgi:Ribonuclease G/E